MPQRPPRRARPVTIVTHLFAIVVGLAVLLAPPEYQPAIAVAVATVAVPLMAIIGSIWADRQYWRGRQQARGQALDLVELAMGDPHQAPTADDADWQARCVGCPDRGQARCAECAHAPRG